MHGPHLALGSLVPIDITVASLVRQLPVSEIHGDDRLALSEQEKGGWQGRW